MRVAAPLLAAALLGCAPMQQVPGPADGASPDTIILSANTGQYDLRLLGSPVRKGELAASVKLRSFNSGDGFSTAAYVGFQSGNDRRNSVHFFVAHVNPKDPYLTAGYRIIEGGKETHREFLSYQRNLQTTIQVWLSFDEGITTLKIEHLPPEVIRTPFSEVTRFLMVSSSKAEFKIDPSLRDLQ